MTGGKTFVKIPEENTLHCVRAFGYGDLALLTAANEKGIQVARRSVRISSLKVLFNKSSVVTSYKQENTTLAHIAVTDSHIAVCNTGLGNLKVYNASGDELFTIGEGTLQRPWGISLLRKGSVLVTDARTGMLYKYRLESDAKPVWVCRDLQSPTGICVDANGNILVASNEAKRIYVVSPEGEYVIKYRENLFNQITTASKSEAC